MADVLDPSPPRVWVGKHGRWALPFALWWQQSAVQPLGRPGSWSRGRACALKNYPQGLHPRVPCLPIQVTAPSSSLPFLLFLEGRKAPDISALQAQLPASGSPSGFMESRLSGGSPTPGRREGERRPGVVRCEQWLHYQCSGHSYPAYLGIVTHTTWSRVSLFSSAIGGSCAFS